MVYRCVAIFVLLMSSSLHAETLPADISRAQAKVDTRCAQCHGKDGNSVASSFPNLSGQHETYLRKQLTEFRKGPQGLRNDPTMYGMAQDLTDQDIIDLSAYFSSQTPKGGESQAADVTLGQKIYRGGDLTHDIPPCSSCHGDRGQGNELANFPRLSGQHPDYILLELKKFRSGERSNDINGIMRDIAKRLTDEQIQAVSQYVSGLH